MRLRSPQRCIVVALVLVSPSALAAWPPNAVPGGTYVVHPSEATMSIADLSLPDDFTLTFDPSIRVVKWTVDKLSFGKNVTIDLSAPRSAAASGASAGPKPGQPRWGRPGAPGDPGGQGAPGAPATALAMRVKMLASPTSGSLWIKNDGGPGGAGGGGGKGQTGGGSTCGGGSEGPRTHGGQGGWGGWGGPGGPGGPTSFVVIRIDTLAVGFEDRQSACSNVCGTSSRPPRATQNNGEIVIWGAPGCGGSGGPGGPGGGGDRSVPRRVCHDFPFTNVIVHGGVDGPTGKTGAAGPNGFCPGFGIVEGPPAPIVQPYPPSATARDKCVAGDAGGCTSYATDLRQTCGGSSDPMTATICRQRAMRWEQRGVVLDRALAACSAASGDVLECAGAREMLRTMLSPAACDAAAGGGRFF